MKKMQIRTRFVTFRASAVRLAERHDGKPFENGIIPWKKKIANCLSPDLHFSSVRPHQFDRSGRGRSVEI